MGTLLEMNYQHQIKPPNKCVLHSPQGSCHKKIKSNNKYATVFTSSTKSSKKGDGKKERR